jgi:lysozyme family protein
MSTFEAAIAVVLKHEGVLTDDKNDPGGMTHYGISLRYLKTLAELDREGFSVGDINHDGRIDGQDVRAMQMTDAIELYRVYWWDPYRYAQITDQALATKVFDLTVNMGSDASHRCLQRAVRAASGTCLVEDGVLGPATLRSVNALPTDSLLSAYRSEAASHYRLLHQLILLPFGRHNEERRRE